MRKFLLLTLTLSSLLYGVTLEELIDSSLAKSPSLEVIESKLLANKQAINISNQFSNPEFLLTKNSLDSSQAMSQTVLSIKQKIPYFSKRDTNKKVSLAQEKILEQRLQSAKVALVQSVKNEAYTIWELEELSKIVETYMNLTQKNIELYESYTTLNGSAHMGIMKAELSLLELKTQKSVLDAKIYSAYSRLSYLSAYKVDKLDISLKIEKKPELKELQNSLSLNPQILLQERKIAKQSAKVKMASINNYPDINLIAGYSYRENFDDYVNFGIGLSLPIYSTEEYKEEKARAVLLSAKSQKEDTESSVNATLKIYYAQMLSAYEVYHIVQDDALPKLAHMFELSSSSISTGSELFNYIDILFSKLNLEKKSINAVSTFKRAQAKISQLKGETK